jgi:hypothetical protein
LTIADTNLVTPRKIAAGVGMLLTVGGVACGITLLFLGMRSVMEVGGACADGGPFAVAQPCPEGIPTVIVGGFFGAAICVAMNMVMAVKHKIPSIVVLAFPALFLALGYNFLDLGLNPPFGETGPTVGWVVCAAFFVLFGGFLLVLLINAVVKGVPEPAPGNVTIQNLDIGRLIGTAAPGTPKGTKSDFEDPFDDPSIVDELEQLAALHRTGALSDAEFKSAKRRILEDGGTR